jgi:hypothetical protein
LSRIGAAPRLRHGLKPLESYVARLDAAGNLIDTAPIVVASFNWQLPPSAGITDARVRVMVSDLEFQTSSDGAGGGGEFWSAAGLRGSPPQSSLPRMTAAAGAGGGPGRKHARAAKAASVLVSLLIALVGAEAFLRVTDRFRPPRNPPQCGYWDPAICSMYVPNADFGYTLRPSTATEYSYPESGASRRLAVVSNRRGFRDARELDEREDRPRVLVLGDSFVFGEGVQAEERFTSVLEDITGFRVDSAGMTGWGPDLMLRALEAVDAEADPDIVLLCLYTHDFRRVHPLYAGLGFEVPRYELRDGRLVTIPYPPPTVWQKLRLLWAISPARRSWDSGMWDLHRAILDRFRELAAERDFRLGLLFLPGRSDTPADIERREWLAGYAEEADTWFLDLTGPVLERPRDEFFIAGGNPHWNPAGHAVVAANLGSFVKGMLPGR